MNKRVFFSLLSPPFKAVREIPICISQLNPSCLLTGVQSKGKLVHIQHFSNYNDNWNILLPNLTQHARSHFNTLYLGSNHLSRPSWGEGGGWRGTMAGYDFWRGLIWGGQFWKCKKFEAVWKDTGLAFFAKVVKLYYHWSKSTFLWRVLTVKKFTQGVLCQKQILITHIELLSPLYWIV